MSTDSTSQYNSLSWVKEQIDVVLTDAQTSLSDYIEHPDKTESLQQCADHLRLVCGTLQMVEIYGASMLAEEMQKTAQAQLDGTADTADAFDILMRSILQLPDYLEGLQAGGVDSPIKLLPLINDLRAARKDSLLSESVLFLPDLDSVDIKGLKIAAGVKEGQLLKEAKRLRTHYQLGLVDFIKNNKVDAALKRMLAVSVSLEKSSSNLSVKKFWVVINAFIESLIDGSVESNASAKKLLGSVDRQIKALADSDEKEFSKSISEELFKNVLYYVGQGKSSSKRAAVVSKTYKLNELLPDDLTGKDAGSGMSGLNTELFVTVSAGIKDDLTQVKNALEIFIHSSEKNVDDLNPQVEQLEKIADTYGMLGLESSRTKTMEQAAVVASVAKGEKELSDDLINTIADELLSAELELNDYIAKRSGLLDSSVVAGGDDAIPAAEYREVLSTVVKEGLTNFTSAKETILSYISGNGDIEQLQNIIDGLEEVRGITLMLAMERVEKQVEDLKKYVQLALINSNHIPDEEEQDAVADVVTCIEYFLESKVEGRLGVEAGLDAGDKAAEFLLSACVQYEGSVAPDNEEPVGEETVTEKTDDSETETTVAEQPVVEEPVVEKSAPKPVTTEVAHEEYIILADDADEEILEIFIEEAVEVFETLSESYPKWKTDNDNEDELAVVRRSFHTLKGSGRLIGAQLIGEFSWKFENLLNRVIDKQVSPTSILFDTFDEVMTVIPQLIEQLKGNREPISNIYQLMQAADILSEGGTPDFSAASQEAVAQETPAQDTVTQEAATQVVEESAGVTVEEVVVEETVLEPDNLSSDDEVLEVEADDAAVDISSFDEIDESPEITAVGNDEFVVSLDDSEDVTTGDLTDDLDVSGLEVEDLGSEEIIVGDTEESFEQDSDDEISLEGLMDSDDDFTDESLFDVSELTESSEESSAGEDDDDVIDISDSFQDEDDDISLEDLMDSGDSLSGLDVGSVSETPDSQIAPEIESLDDGLVELGEDSQDLDQESEIDLSGDFSAMDDDIELTESVVDESQIESSEDDFESVAAMDPVLFGIYYEESMSRLLFVKELLEQHDTGKQVLSANKDLMRAFHTLYGSARTAEIEPVAEICGATEKYVKEREAAVDITIPDDVVEIIRDVTSASINMIEGIKAGATQESNQELLARINAALEAEQKEQSQQVPEVSLDAPADIQIDEPLEESVEELAVIDDEASVQETLEEQDASDQADSDQIVSEQVTQPAATQAAASGADKQTETPEYSNIDEDLIDIFIEEAEELLESCDSSINALQDNVNNKEAITVLQRDMHTFKGGARMAELKSVGDLTHALESMVIELENDNISADSTFFKVLHESMDTLNDMLESVRNRADISYSLNLVKNIEALSRGEALEVVTSEPIASTVEEVSEEGLLPDEIDEEIVISDEALAAVEESVAISEAEKPKVEEEVVEPEAKRPGWGERAGDANNRDSQDQVRIRADLLNSLVNSAGEVSIFHARMGKQITDVGFNLNELDQTVLRLNEQLRNLAIETEIQIRSSYEKETDDPDENFDPLEMDKYSTMQQLSRSLAETANDVQSIKDIIAEIVRDSETLLLQESRVSTELQEGLMRTRMVRFGGLSSRMKRIVRQTGRELNKEVELEITGDSIEIDRKVLDNIVAPLEHMLRNAVAHGIEEPQVRVANGKEETGKIKIAVSRTGSEIILTITDDGAGMNVDAIREKAIKQGLLEKENNLNDQDILQFILKAGFSTATNVTQIAGRGVGMDVVDSEIKQLGGLLEISTEVGKGSQFVITLPVTLAINQALLVSANEDLYAIPLASIEGVVRVPGTDLQKFYDSDDKFYEFNGIEYELKHMGNLLSGNQLDYSNQPQLFPVLLAKVGEHFFALHVEDLVERREIVVKPVGHQLGMVRGVSGATILADGRVVLIIEMAALVVGETLFRSTESSVPAAVQKADEETVVMIVDDSITIRKVTARMLERNGINVLSAKDGVDATDKLQENIPDLMLLDIEMPRMDGFELATYMRNDERLKDIPIIMITSRTGEKHKEKAFEIGVNKYLGKPYQEEDLMKNINEIIG